ncbi:MAG: FMN-binding protein [Candidatus Nanopelagicales bacterium]
MAEVGFLRRIAPAIVLAVAGGALLYLLPSSPDADSSSAEDISSSETGPGESGAPSPAESSSGGAKPSKSSATAQPTSGDTRTITGDPVDFRFGTIQAEVTLQGSTIVDIATLTAPGGGYQRYTDRAVPTMRQEILQAQSTQVAAASGATYTSMAYAQSVQSALDKA